MISTVGVAALYRTERGGKPRILPKGGGAGAKSLMVYAQQREKEQSCNMSASSFSKTGLFIITISEYFINTIFYPFDVYVSNNFVDNGNKN